MYVRQIFGGLKLRNTRRMWIRFFWRVCTPKIIDGCMSVKYLGGLHPQKYAMDVCLSNIWGVYTPEIFDGFITVKYLGGLHLQNI